MAPAAAIILFDGTCHLCNGAVRFILRHDSTGQFRFASMQSPQGAALAARHGFAGPSPGSMVLVVSEICYTRSTAALQIARRLDRPWPLLYALIWAPRPLRDAVYAQIAKRRHRWFGRAQQCVDLPPDRQAALPTPPK
jgi:predicted DCC family thiol-disulfide oxidoreductase YuxK